MLKSGLYEQVINQQIRQELENIQNKNKKVKEIDHAEASKILSQYVSDIIAKSLEFVADNGGDLKQQITFINRIISTIINETCEPEFTAMSVDERAEQLLAIIDTVHTTGAITSAIRPETSLSQSSLFTGAIHEPAMFSELKKEILSSNQIDMLVSFIKWSGLRLIIDELKTFTQNGGRLRIITTSYMGATDAKAIEMLHQLPNTEIKISYDTKRTRLHAKTYIFYRDTGFTTAYIGSSNLSNAAISSGLEWNVKATAKDLPDTLRKISATFESYWNSIEFDYYDENQKDRLVKALKSEGTYGFNAESFYLFDIAPYPFQKEILDKLDAERKVRGYTRNLIVAATGTGKTVISAFDYKRFRSENRRSPCRLLFIAHREEILKQSLACFRNVLKDSNFGDLFVGSYRPDNVEHLFMSIQTFNSQDWSMQTEPEFYDFIVVDEFHHAAAPTYQKLLTYYNPKILLGLTATPERMDGRDVTEYFNNRIAAEIRLPEAIERKLLCPFQYFGVTDIVDLHDLKWVRGGYDRRELSNLYTISKHIAERRADVIIQAVSHYITDLNEARGLGFCVSIENAEFMAGYFTSRGIPSMFLTGQSPDEERNNAKSKLVRGDVRFIFVIDIYNEGVDIPEINTVLFLRPTESLTIFLQQLGRGLRLSDDKECLTVLDFIGQANRKYNFEAKFNALIANTTRNIQHELKHGFVSLPKGCYIQLEKKAKEYIYQNIRASFGARAGIVARINSFEDDSNQTLNLENFISYHHLDPREIYDKGSFSRLMVLADVRDDFDEAIEEVLTKAFPKICVIDSRRWIIFLLETLENLDGLSADVLNDREKRMLNMFQFTVWQKSWEDCGFCDPLEGLRLIKKCPVLLAELLELLNYNFNHIDFIDESLDLGFDCPLDLHCMYTRDQILVALDYMTPANVREGVKYLPDKKIDVFFVTLNKSDKDYSPTTMYNDYSINESLFHWQSQSTTGADSVTGRRYINHKQMNVKTLLFVREFKVDLAGTAPYTFLGTINYVQHEGSKPMNITYRLDRPIPAKYLKKTNKLVVG